VRKDIVSVWIDWMGVLCEEENRLREGQRKGKGGGVGGVLLFMEVAAQNSPCVMGPHLREIWAVALRYAAFG